MKGDGRGLATITPTRPRMLLASSCGEWHPPIVTDSDGERVTPAEVRKAVRMVGGATNGVVAILKGLRDATYSALIESKDGEKIARVRAEFEAFCAQGEYTDWRAAWRAFDAQPRKPPKAPRIPAQPLIARLQGAPLRRQHYRGPVNPPRIVGGREASGGVSYPSLSGR